MKSNVHNFYHLFNAVKKSNGIKSYIWYVVNNITYYTNILLRLLNY
jgi:hypothetical protein